MILSVKPPYEITPRILKLVSSISEGMGEVNSSFLHKPSPQLRKQNRIQTIQSSLKIEGNTLTEEQITALVERKKVLGPRKDILEVVNAIQVYDQIREFNPTSEKDFLKAHAILMNGLGAITGEYRNKGVGIVKGNQVKHIAPPYSNVPGLMKELFDYLKNDDDLPLIKSCVFHYELEFIHPFEDGNGRMGRLWQTVILLNEYDVFEFLPFETLINKSQEEYYQALSMSDMAGKSTCFLEYMLDVIDQSLKLLLNANRPMIKDVERLEYFISKGMKEFTRKDYRKVFKNISAATASRDLKKGIELKWLESKGEINQTKYFVK
jgi:Fic family protein